MTSKYYGKKTYLIRVRSIKDGKIYDETIQCHRPSRDLKVHIAAMLRVLGWENEVQVFRQTKSWYRVKRSEETK